MPSFISDVKDLSNAERPHVARSCGRVVGGGAWARRRAGRPTGVPPRTIRYTGRGPDATSWDRAMAARRFRYPSRISLTAAEPLPQALVQAVVRSLISSMGTSPLVRVV